MFLRNLGGFNAARDVDPPYCSFAFGVQIHRGAFKSCLSLSHTLFPFFFLKPKSAEHILEALDMGNRNRTQHPTDMNATSSRSHAVFQVFQSSVKTDFKGY